MIGQLAQHRAIESRHIQVCVSVRERIVARDAFAHEENPLPVGRHTWGGKTAIRIGDQALLHAGRIVDLPNLRTTVAARSRTEDGRLIRQWPGIHAHRVARQKVVANIVSPNADAVGFLAGKEDLCHIGRIDRRIIVVGRGDLSANVALGSTRPEDLMGLAALFGEANPLAIGRIAEIDDRLTIRALCRASLFAQLLHKDIGSLITQREIGDVLAALRNIKNAVGKPL